MMMVMEARREQQIIGDCLGDGVGEGLVDCVDGVDDGDGVRREGQERTADHR